MTIRRHAQVIRVRMDRRDDYVAAHANPPAEVLAAISAENIRSYSIFLHDDLLFAYVEYDSDSMPTGAEEQAGAMREWTTRMIEMLEPLPTRAPGERWAAMEEVFRFEQRREPTETID